MGLFDKLFGAKEPSPVAAAAPVRTVDQKTIDQWIEKGDACAQKEDWIQAAKFYSMAAAQHDSCALKKLADCCRDGKGIPQDPARAFSYYLTSAQIDPFYAAYETARCYEEGIGTNPSPKDAFLWYETAMNGCLRNLKAKQKVCEFYKKGIYVRKDPKKAAMLEGQLKANDRRMDELDQMFKDMGM